MLLLRRRLWNQADRYLSHLSIREARRARESAASACCQRLQSVHRSSRDSVHTLRPVRISCVRIYTCARCASTISARGVKRTTSCITVVRDCFLSGSSLLKQVASLIRVSQRTRPHKQDARSSKLLIGDEGSSHCFQRDHVTAHKPVFRRNVNSKHQSVSRLINQEKTHRHDGIEVTRATTRSAWRRRSPGFTAFAASFVLRMVI